MKSVLLRLTGPMQSWGTASRFEIRESEMEPSKSGVLGLVGAAMGVERGDRTTISRLAGLEFAVRVDRPGVMRVDYQTAGGGNWPGRRNYGVYKASGGSSSNATISRRYYLADASFVVALGSTEVELIDAIDAALREPRWAMFLGRKGYTASAPIAAGTFDGSPEAALKAELWGHSLRAGESREVQIVLDGDPRDGEAIRDVPIDFTPDEREFGVRYIRRIPWTLPEQEGT